MSLAVSEYSGTAEEWDGFVRRQAGWTPFHLHGWRTIYETVAGHECPYLAVRDTAGALAAVLPLVRVRSLLFGHYLVSQPFVNYGGPLGDAGGVGALAAAAVERARVQGVKLLELRNRGPLPIDLPVSHRKITVVLDLPAGSPDQLFQRFDSKLRSQIRRPQKEGVTVRFGRGQVEPFFGVFAAHMRDLGTPTQPRRLFQAIAELFPNAWFGCAYYQGKPVACGAGFRWGNEFEMTWASSLYAYNRLAPNMLLYWAFMEHAIAEGVSLFNFGRCSPESGTHRFKRQWGSRDEQLHWYQYASHGEAATPSPDDGAYSWGPWVWRRLPLPIATALGPWIVRSIP
jgi:FemAB-related protein (PEP-CTERM system-associated)